MENKSNVVWYNIAQHGKNSITTKKLDVNVSDTLPFLLKWNKNIVYIALYCS